MVTSVSPANYLKICFSHFFCWGFSLHSDVGLRIIFRLSVCHDFLVAEGGSTQAVLRAAEPLPVKLSQTVNPDQATWRTPGWTWPHCEVVGTSCAMLWDQGDLAMLWVTVSRYGTSYTPDLNSHPLNSTCGPNLGAFLCSGWFYWVLLIIFFSLMSSDLGLHLILSVLCVMVQKCLKDSFPVLIHI